MTIMSAVWMTRRRSPSRVHLVLETLIEDEDGSMETYCGRVVPDDALAEVMSWGAHDMDAIRQVCLRCGRTRQFLVAVGQVPLCVPGHDAENMCGICLERVGLELAECA